MPNRTELSAVALVAVFLLLAQTDADAVVSVLAPFTLWTAGVTRTFLTLMGLDPIQTATVISHPNGFAYEVHFRCTGIVPVGAFAIMVLAGHGSAGRKMRLLTLGTASLVALNFVRLVHLFSVGVYEPAAFDLAHSVIWQGILILAVLLLSLVSFEVIKWPRKWNDGAVKFQFVRLPLQKNPNVP